MNHKEINNLSNDFNTLSSDCGKSESKIFAELTKLQNSMEKVNKSLALKGKASEALNLSKDVTLDTSTQADAVLGSRLDAWEEKMTQLENTLKEQSSAGNQSLSLNTLQAKVNEVEKQFKVDMSNIDKFAEKVRTDIGKLFLAESNIKNKIDSLHKVSTQRAENQPV